MAAELSTGALVMYQIQKKENINVSGNNKGFTKSHWKNNICL
jgi:hypothetical protein